MQNVSKENDNENDCGYKILPSHAMITVIKIIKKYISAAEGNCGSFDNVYELENS